MWEDGEYENYQSCSEEFKHSLPHHNSEVYVITVHKEFYIHKKLGISLIIHDSRYTKHGIDIVEIIMI